MVGPFDPEEDPIDTPNTLARTIIARMRRRPRPTPVEPTPPVDAELALMVMRVRRHQAAIDHELERITTHLTGVKRCGRDAPTYRG